MDEVVELLRVKRHNRTWQLVVGFGGGAVCIVAGLIAVVPGAVCAGSVLTYTGGKELAIRNLEDRIRKLGCACVL